nr:hypothetical protein [Azohydromonas sediminis]
MHEQVALHLVLDAFGDDSQSERVRHLQHGLDDRARVVAVREVGDEAAVDLQLLDRQLAQVRQARVAGAEVVDRDVDPGRAEALEGAARGRRVGHRHRLGDLAGQLFRSHAVALQRFEQAVDEGVVAQLKRREVHRHAHAQPGVAPRARLAAGVVNDPRTESADQPVALGQRHEHRRRHEAARRVVPAQQRLGRRDLPAVGVDLRLVQQRQLAACDRVAQVGQQTQALDRTRVARRWRKERMARAARALRGRHRRVGMRDQACAFAVLGVHGDPHRAGQVRLAAVDDEGLLHRRDDTPRERGRGIAAAVDA